MYKDLCFVLMPFGKKPDATGLLIDFDAVYQQVIAPAIEDAGLEPIRADEELAGGVIHKPMFERLLLCAYAVADLTTANANVFYELGVRHAARPGSTVLLFAEGGRLPFDVAPLRALPYTLTPEGTPGDAAAARTALVARLKEALEAAAAGERGARDRPLYQLLEGYPEIDHTRTDAFREQVQYSQEMKDRLADARRAGADAIRAVEQDLGDLASAESGVVIDLMLSYRAVKAWGDMIRLVEQMPAPLADSIMVQEQLGLALNRAGEGEKAERVLEQLIERRGPSSETCGILGRVYKDRWEAAEKAGDRIRARGLLKKAIEAYQVGFEANWKDAYPGINAVTLMELQEPPDARRAQIIPVVAYAVERKIDAGKPDYWDYATRLELAVLAGDEDRALDALSEALAHVREVWEPETTARNLRLIREARERRGEPVGWLQEIEAALERSAHAS